MSLLEIKSISKQFGTTCALDDINLTLAPNRIYGLLGRNGAGKTTLLNLITNRIFPTSGEITINGANVQDSAEALLNVFYMTEENLYPPAMRVRELFRWTKEFYPNFDLAEANALADRFELRTNKRVKELSTGYTSIFKAIIALATNAPITMFDEPVLGLDANHRDLFYRELIQSFSRNPRMIVISTHLIEEVADVLEEVIIIRSGRLVHHCPVEELLDSAYLVSGEAGRVEQFVAGKRCARSETMGRFTSVTVLEQLSSAEQCAGKELGLDFARVELQQLFISLTN